MQNIRITLWGWLAALSLLWLATTPFTPMPQNFIALRGLMTQYSGLVAMGCMSLIMVLALRPRWPEKWLGGLDKMYRLHKWLGIAALVAAVIHWLWAQGPKWATGLGLMTRPERRGGPWPTFDNPIQQTLSSMRGTAEGLGEWAFYIAAALIILALVKWFPYRLFFKTHRILAATYLVLVFHAVVLIDFKDWSQPVGWVMAVLMAAGTYSALVVLLRRVGRNAQVQGSITALGHYPAVRVHQIEVALPQGWPGHHPGQFAFVTSDPSEGAHPYTIASAWNEAERRLTFVVKELGDHTRRLKEKLSVGQTVTVEGPYGCFTFADDCPTQIWVGGGIGITPFIARMQYLAARGGTPAQAVHLFHTTTEEDETALARLRADAAAAGITLYILVDARDGLLSGARIREMVPGWQDASLWFCGPTGFGQALRRDFAAQGLAVGKRFHQELFAMR